MQSLFQITRKAVAALTLILISTIGFAQVIWQEDFSGYPNYQAIGNDNNLPAGPDWTTNAGDCDDDAQIVGGFWSGSDISTSQSYWGTTTAGEFRITDVEGLSCCGSGTNRGGTTDNEWTTEIIDISTYCAVDVSLTAREVGKHENYSGGCNNGDDRLFAYFSVDGGAYIPFTTNGDLQGEFTSATASHTGIQGSTLQIMLLIGNKSNSEDLYFDDVTVSVGTPTGSINLTMPDVTLTCSQTEGSLSVSVSNGTAPYTYVWKNQGGTTLSETSNTLSNASPGTYSVTVTDACGRTQTISAEIIPGPSITVNASMDQAVSCNGNNDGTATATASNGTPNYTFEWFDASNNSIATGATVNTLSKGTYTVVATDSKGCSNSTTVTISEAPALNTSIASQTNNYCFGGNNGSVTISTNGGTLSYTYSLDGGTFQASNTFNNLSQGNYTITVKDNSGCTQDIAVTITETPELTGTVSSFSNPSCNGGTDGDITVNASGGTPSYTYSIDGTNFQNSSTFTNLAQGNYTVTVKDANGCTTTISQTLAESTAIIISFTNQQDATCFGASAASFQVNVSGGTPSYTYSIDGTNFQTGNNFNNLPAGTYNVTVKDANGCSNIESVTLNEATDLVISTSSISDVTCNGGNDGAFTVSASGGTPNYSYSIDGSNFQTSDTFNNLAEGTYSLTVKDQNGCKKTTSVTVSEPNTLTITNTNTNDISCHGGNDGSLTVQASGGTPSYTYSIDGSNFQASTIFNGLTAANYTITTKDANGCNATTNVQLNEPTVLSISVDNQTDVSCNHTSNGSVTVSSSGGTPNYSYAIDGGSFQASPTFNNLSSGTYTITSRDANNCETSTNVTINQTAAITLSVDTKTDVLCAGGNDGKVVLATTGGSPNFTYSMNGGAGQSSPTFSNLSTGTYSFEVTDANGCTGSGSATINEPTTLTLSNTSTTNVTCNGGNDGSIDVSASGGTLPYSYSINSGAPQSNGTFSGLSKGTYNIDVYDGNNCTSSIAVNITEPNSLVLSSNHQNISCHGMNDGTITINVAGGTAPYQYTWSDSNGSRSENGNSANNLSADTYQVLVTDDNGCTETISVSLTEPNSFTASINEDQNIACANQSTGQLTANATGGTSPYTYTWSNSQGPLASTNATQTNLPEDTYSVSIKDANGCAATATHSLIAPSQLLVSLTIDQMVNCANGNDGQISATISGGTPNYIISWKDENGARPETGTTLNNIGEGNYEVTVVDNNGCSNNAATTLTQPQAIQLNINVDQHVTCKGDADGGLTAQANGGTGALIFQWSNGPTQATNQGIPAGSYTVVVTDQNGCSKQLSETINEPLQSLNTNLLPTSPLCKAQDGRIVAQVSGGNSGYQFVWSEVSSGVIQGEFNNVLDNIGEGEYTVVVTDQTNCSTTESITLTRTNVPVDISTNSLQNPSCFNTCDAQLEVQVNNSSNSPFQYILNNIITIDTTLESNTTLPFTDLCTSASNYKVKVIDAKGCESDFLDFPAITAPPTINIDLEFDTINCTGLGNARATALGGNAPYFYSWSNSGWNTDSTRSSITHIPSGSYGLTVTDDSGCNQSTAFYQDFTVPAPVVDFEMEYEEPILENPEVRFYGVSDQDILFWEWEFLDTTATDVMGALFGKEVSYAYNTLPGSYPIRLTAQNTKGCETEIIKYLDVTGAFSIFVPNAFTPDGDGINDTFGPVISGATSANYHFYIFNRWGEEIFHTEDINEKWNGSTKRGTDINDVNSSIYVFRVIIEKENGLREERTGTVNLLK